jgi:hypothetical protein
VVGCNAFGKKGHSCPHRSLHNHRHLRRVRVVMGPRVGYSPTAEVHRRVGESAVFTVPTPRGWLLTVEHLVLPRTAITAVGTIPSVEEVAPRAARDHIVTASAL